MKLSKRERRELKVLLYLNHRWNRERDKKQKEKEKSKQK